MSDFEIEPPPDFEILGPEPKLPKTRSPLPLIVNYDLRRLVEATIASVHGYGWASDAAVDRVINELTMIDFSNTRFQRDVANDCVAYAIRRWVIEHPQIVKQKGR